MGQKTEPIHIRIDLEDKEAEEFLAFKERNRIKTSTDAIHFALGLAYKYEKLQAAPAR